MISFLVLTVLFFLMCHGGQLVDGWLSHKAQEANAAWKASHPLPPPPTAAERRVALEAWAREASR